MESPVFEFEKYKDGLVLTKFIEGPEMLEIPEEIEGLKVIAIGPECFKENGIMLTSVTLPDTVKELKCDAFAYTVCLEELHLPEGLEAIGANYLIASGLGQAYIPAGVERIDRPELIDRSFKVSPDNKRFFTDGYGLYERDEAGIRLVAVNSSETRECYEIQEGTREIALNALRDAATIELLVIPESLTVIKEGTLSYNGGVVNENKGVKAVKVSEENPRLCLVSDMLCERLDDRGLKLIRYFGGEKANIPEEVKIIGFESFKNTNVRKLHLPDSLEQIKPGAFLGCPLKLCYIGESKISFGDEDRFAMESFLECFGKDGRLYDYTVLDEYLLNQYLTEGRIRMIVTRLKYPKELPEDVEKKLFARVSDELTESVLMLSEADNLDTVEEMGELGFFTEDNIDLLTRLMSNAEKKEMTAWFMSYKNNNFKKKNGFDFEL